MTTGVVRVAMTTGVVPVAMTTGVVPATATTGVVPAVVKIESHTSFRIVAHAMEPHARATKTMAMWRASILRSAAKMASVPMTLWGRSPTNPTCQDARLVPSAFRIGSPLSACRQVLSTRFSMRSRAPRFGVRPPSPDGSQKNRDARFLTDELPPIWTGRELF